jgi:hypothetical protein
MISFDKPWCCAISPVNGEQHMQPVIVTVRPSRDKDGRKRYGSRGQLFDAEILGRIVVESVSTPLLDSCRLLASKRMDAATVVVMRHAGQDHDALRTTVGFGASRSVHNDRFVKWRPSPFAAKSK